ncbi:MAG: peptidyl-prolyl cis-trans isomerase, partial [Myxococcota bacterium]
WDLFVALTVVGCTPPAETAKNAAYPAPDVSDQGEAIAVVGPVTLTTDEFAQRLKAQTPFARMQLQDPKRLQEFIKNEVRLEILAQEAWRRGLQDDPEVLQQFKRILTQRVIQDEMTRLAAKIKITDGELIKAYEAQKAEFVKAPQVRLSQIVRFVKSDAERTAAQKLLAKTRQEVLAQERKSNYRAFANAAKKSSQDETTRDAGGDLQFLTRDQLTERYGAQVAQHMFDAVKVGDLAVADAPNAVVLFKKTGVRRGVNRTFEQVRSQLRGRLGQQKRTEAFNNFVDKIKKDQNIEVLLDRSSAIDLDAAGIPQEPNQ